MSSGGAFVARSGAGISCPCSREHVARSLPEWVVLFSLAPRCYYLTLDARVTLLAHAPRRAPRTPTPNLRALVAQRHHGPLLTAAQPSIASPANCQLYHSHHSLRAPGAYGLFSLRPQRRSFLLVCVSTRSLVGSKRKKIPVSARRTTCAPARLRACVLRRRFISFICRGNVWKREKKEIKT